MKYNWKKILTRSLWLLAGAGTIVLLGAAMVKKSQKKCSDIHIEITGAEKHIFIDEKDVMELLNSAGRPTGNTVSALDLRAMETLVEKNPWVRNAEMFFDNQQVLQIRIEERQPVARVFTVSGNSFYLDSAGMRLLLSDKLSARVPMFTGFPSDKQKLAKPDSLLLMDIVNIGSHIMADSFWAAQVAQVAVTPQAGFELVPVLGDHIVELGNAEELDEKFSRLMTFYRKAWLQNGINKYEKLDVRYANQVVAIRKGTAKALADSARAKEIMSGMQAGMENVINAAIAKEKTDSVVTAPEKVVTPLPVVKKAATKKSSEPLNNKTEKKSLSKGDKLKHEPKAVMKKGASPTR